MPGRTPITGGGGSAHVIAPSVVTPLQGIAAAAPGGTKVTYSKGNTPDEPNGDAALLADAVAAARSASVAVVFAGLYEREGKDLHNINLSPAVNQLIEAVSHANPNTVVVLNTGSAVTMPWLTSVKGVVEAWYPGQEDGNSIADILFGKVDPSGKLPVTFPVSLSDVPAATPAQWPGVDAKIHYSEGLLVGYRWYDTKKIDPTVSVRVRVVLHVVLILETELVAHQPCRKAGPRQPRVNVTNTGSVTGSDTVQAYVDDPTSTREPPEQLKGFDKITLDPGQTAPVSIPLGPQSFSIWSSSDQAWVEEPGQYRVMVGDSSAKLPLKTTISIP